jgi:beta-lactamase class A
MRDIGHQIERMAAELGGTVGVAVRDIRNAFDFSFHEDAKMLSASTIKIPVLVEAVRHLSEGKATLDTEFVLDESNRTPGSGVLRHMHGGMKLTYHDVMVLMIITSDNHATNLLIDLLTPDSITATMRRFGYAGTEVQRRIFDNEAMDRGLNNWIAAVDIADLCKRIYTKTAVGGEWDELALRILGWQLDKERLRVLLPEEACVANKPGEQENTMHYGGLVWTDDFAYSICVATTGWQSRREAYMTIAGISRLVYDTVSETCGCDHA